MTIRQKDQLPLHYQITNELRESIKGGLWNVGDLFPTDKDLMQKYHVSSTTVRRAVAQIVQEGWLERKAGKGTFVKKDAVEETLGRLTGFFEEMRSRGFEPKADVINLCPIDLTPKVLEKVPRLSIFGSQKLFLVERVQKIDDVPIVYLQSYWPYEYGEKLSEYNLADEGLYELAARELGVTLTWAEQTIEARVARKKEAQLLKIKPGFPVLVMERVAYTDNRAIELSINVYRGDRYKYRATLHKDDNNVEGVLLT